MFAGVAAVAGIGTLVSPER